MKLLCKDFNIVNMRVMFSFAMVSWHGVWWRWSCSWVCFKHCLLSFWECHEKPNARKTMWLGLEIKLIKDWIGVMVVLICLCTRELTIVWRRYTYGSCYRSLHPQNLSKSLGTSPEQLPKRLESSNKPCWTFIRTNFHVDYFVIYNHFAR